MSPPPSESQTGPAALDPLSKAASDLNNLLQIMASTSALIQQAGGPDTGSDSYLHMLRASIERAEQVATQLVERAGGPKEKTLLRSELRPPVGSKAAAEVSAKKNCVLVVDDEQMALALVERLMSDAGHRDDFARPESH